MSEQLTELKQVLQDVADLGGVMSLMGWDQSTYMPPAGAAARGRQTALLAKLSQQKFTDPRVGQLLDELQPYAESLPADHDDVALIKTTRRDYEQLLKIPPEFMAEMVEHVSISYQAWMEARPENDFGKVQPLMEKTVDLSRRYAEFFPGYDHILDPFIDTADFGMKAETVRAVFSELRGELVPLVKAITEQPLADDSCLHQFYADNKQIEFAMDVASAFGFSETRGRLDKSPHPFMTKFAHNDIRITTRKSEEFLGDTVFSIFHEVGHALYELGIDEGYAGTPLSSGTSAGVHESQSRLWENVVGRSRPFWEYQFPRLQAIFPDQLGGVSLDQFYRAINRVEPSLIRTEADEVTYNLHVMIRFDFECDLLEGNLAVKDLPDAWHARYESDLGLRAPNDSNGCLQDIHWYAGLIGGGFQGYTLGNIMSGLFFSQAVTANPEIPDQIGRGEYEPLHSWLVDQIYRHGRKYTTNELIEQVTGGPLRIGPYVDYLKGKYGELYSLS